MWELNPVWNISTEEKSEYLEILPDYAAEYKANL